MSGSGLSQILPGVLDGDGEIVWLLPGWLGCRWCLDDDLAVGPATGP